METKVRGVLDTPLTAFAGYDGALWSSTVHLSRFARNDGSLPSYRSHAAPNDSHPQTLRPIHSTPPPSPSRDGGIARRDAGL
jgi:hypothetical protein